MKIAVVGSQGLLGSALMAQWNLGGANDELIPLDYPEFDIGSRLFVVDALESLRPQVIINAAGVNMIDYLEQRPNTARTVHIQGTANLREGAKRLGALLVQMSCAEVFYQQQPGGPAHGETDVPEPASVFALTKLDSERAASEYKRHLIIRTSTLFGQGGTVNSRNLVTSLLNVFRRTRDFHALDDLETSPTWTNDLVPAIRLLVERDARGLFHLAALERATPLQVANYLLKCCGLKNHRAFPLSMIEYGTKAPHSHNTVLCSAKYQAEQPNYPLSHWQEGVDRFLHSREIDVYTMKR